MIKRLSLALLIAVVFATAIAPAFATIDGVISFTFQCNDRRQVGLNTNANLPVNTAPSITYSNGSGASQANVLYQGSLALTAGTLTVDLSGVLLDSYGTVVNLARIKGIYIKNTDPTNPLTVGPTTTNAWSTWLNAAGSITLPAGAWIGCATPDATGWTVTETTGDMLLFTGTGAQTFQLVVLGASS